MNCSPIGLPSLRAAVNSASMSAVTCFSWASASAMGSVATAKSLRTSPMPGIVTGMSRSSMYWTIIMAWFRSSRDWR